MLLIFANNRNHVEGKIFLWIHVEFFDFYSGIETKDETEKENKDFRRAPKQVRFVPASGQPRGRRDLYPTTSVRPQKPSRSS